MPQEIPDPIPPTSDFPTDPALPKPRSTRARKQSSKPASKPASKSASKPSSKHAGKRASKKKPPPIIDPAEVPNFRGRLHSQKTDSPVRLEAVSRAYEMYVLARMNFTEIGRALGIDRQTASGYVAEESARRRGERAELRYAMIDKTLNNIDEVEVFYFDKMHSANFKGDEGRTILECQKQRTALMGLDPGIVIKDERESINPFAEIKTAAEALAVLKALPDGGGGPK